MSLTTTQENNLVAHIAGVSGVSGYGDGVSVHVSAAEKAALDNAASDTRQGAATATNTVVTKNNTGLLSTSERAALASAIGVDSTHALGADNPLVANAMSIAVPVLATGTTTDATSWVVLSASAQDLDTDLVNVLVPVLWDSAACVYVGGQGVSSGVSSAYQYFSIEDQYGTSILTSSNEAIYVTNVFWNGTSAPLNPTSNANAATDGFVTLGSNVVYLKLSQEIAADTVFCVRMNTKGRMQNLASTWNKLTYPNFPSPTVYRNVKQPYVAATTGDFETVTIGPSSASKIKVTVAANTSSQMLATLRVPVGTAADTVVINESTGDMTITVQGVEAWIKATSTYSTEATCWTYYVTDTASNATYSAYSLTSWGRVTSYLAAAGFGTLNAASPTLSYTLANPLGTVTYGGFSVCNDYSDDSITLNDPTLFVAGTAGQVRIGTGLESTDKNTANLGAPTVLVTRSSTSTNSATASIDTYNIYAKTWNTGASTQLVLGAVDAQTTWTASTVARLGLASTGTWTPVSSVFGNVTSTSFSATLTSGMYVQGEMFASGPLTGTGVSVTYGPAAFTAASALAYTQVNYRIYAMDSVFTKYTMIGGLGGYVSSTLPLRYNSDFVSSPANVYGSVIYAYSPNAGTSAQNAYPSVAFGARDVWLFPQTYSATATHSLRFGPALAANTYGNFEFVTGVSPNIGSSIPHVHLLLAAGASIGRYLFIGGGSYSSTTGTYTFSDSSAVCINAAGGVSLMNLYFGRNSDDAGVSPTNPTCGGIVNYTSTTAAIYSHRSKASTYITSGNYYVASSYGGFMPVTTGMYVFGDNGSSGANLYFGSTSPSAYAQPYRANLQALGDIGSAGYLNFQLSSAVGTSAPATVLQLTTTALAPASSGGLTLGTSSAPFGMIYGTVVDSSRITSTTPTPTNTVTGVYAVDNSTSSDELLHSVVKYTEGYSEAPMHKSASTVKLATEVATIYNSGSIGVWEVWDKCYSPAFNCFYGIINYDYPGTNSSGNTFVIVYSYDGIEWTAETTITPNYQLGRMYPKMVCVHGYPVLVYEDKDSASTTRTIYAYTRRTTGWASLGAIITNGTAEYLSGFTAAGMSAARTGSCCSLVVAYETYQNGMDAIYVITAFRAAMSSLGVSGLTAGTSTTIGSADDEYVDHKSVAVTVADAGCAYWGYGYNPGAACMLKVARLPTYTGVVTTETVGVAAPTNSISGNTTGNMYTVANADVDADFKYESNSTFIAANDTYAVGSFTATQASTVCFGMTCAWVNNNSGTGSRTVLRFFRYTFGAPTNLTSESVVLAGSSNTLNGLLMGALLHLGWNSKASEFQALVCSYSTTTSKYYFEPSCHTTQPSYDYSVSLYTSASIPTYTGSRFNLQSTMTMSFRPEIIASTGLLATTARRPVYNLAAGCQSSFTYDYIRGRTVVTLTTAMPATLTDLYYTGASNLPTRASAVFYIQ